MAGCGCGTGALSQTILDRCNPKSLVGIDPSDGFVAHARSTIEDGRAQFQVGDAQKLSAEADSFDVVTSALALNFVPDKQAALHEMRRVAKPGGLISFYVWDYPGGGMGFIDRFWKAAAELDEKAAELDEGKRFPFCTREGLLGLCHDAGIQSAVIEPIEIQSVFPSFEDFWQPFTIGAGPAPGYCMSLSEDQREKLKSRLAQSTVSNSRVELPAKAWAMKAAVA